MSYNDIEICCDVVYLFRNSIETPFTDKIARREYLFFVKSSENAWKIKVLSHTDAKHV